MNGCPAYGPKGPNCSPRSGTYVNTTRASTQAGCLLLDNRTASLTPYARVANPMPGVKALGLHRPHQVFAAPHMQLNKRETGDATTPGMYLHYLRVYACR